MTNNFVGTFQRMMSMDSILPSERRCPGSNPGSLTSYRDKFGKSFDSSLSGRNTDEDHYEKVRILLS